MLGLELGNLTGVAYQPTLAPAFCQTQQSSEGNIAVEVVRVYRGKC